MILCNISIYIGINFIFFLHMQCGYIKLNAAHLLPFGYLDTLSKIVAVFAQL
uniref:Alternative protein RNF19A n=1 Tax=Homo sapiens TaxID=9606 RepID=L8E8P4_HUMAN|nr:alternative protein RNF19A [Homo sapiens]